MVRKTCKKKARAALAGDKKDQDQWKHRYKNNN
jgi:hypothetical protein